jgi:myo-inositol 2-dehydrogenase/D-chiro-inositol 1-dehydrogenase
MKTLNIGLVGAGKAGSSFAMAIRGIPDVEVKAVCTAHTASAQKAAKTLGIPGWTAALEDILSDDDIHGIIIASPDDWHSRQCIAAAEAGKHVLCEKPMCRTLAEADAMIGGAAKSGVVLMVGFTERYNQPCLEARQRIRDGEIGTPRMILARRCHPRSVVRGRSWLNDRETGGVLAYAGTHNIDLVCWFMGSKPRRVYGEMGRLILEGQEFTDCAVMTVLFENGGLASLYETFAYPEGYPHGVDRSIEILGDKGVLHIDFMSQPLRVTTADGMRIADSVTWARDRDRLQGALQAEVRHFADCIRSGQTPMTSGVEGRLALEIAAAAAEASRNGKAVELPR